MTAPPRTVADWGGVACRYYLQPTGWPQSIVIVLATKGEPWLVWDRRGKATRVDLMPAGQSWPDVEVWEGIDAALSRDGRAILMFAKLIDSKRCLRRLRAKGART